MFLARGLAFLISLNAIPIKHPFVEGTLIGVLILGLIQTFITFQGTLSSWWTKIAIGVLLFVFILLQRYLSATSIITKNQSAETVAEMQLQQA